MVSLSLVSVADALVPQVAADWLLTVCRHTGQRWGPNAATELFWYRPPKVHIFEFVVLHAFVCCCFYASRGYCRQAWRQLQSAPRDRSTKSRVNQLLAVVLLVCWMCQVLFKATRPHPFVQLGWLLMPCHLLTLLWAAVLMRGGRERYELNVYLASLAADYHWGPTAAAASPDFGDHQYPIEGYVFVVHHALLLLLPFYFAARYELLPMTSKRLLHVTSVAVLVNVGPYTLYSYVSGLNLNYMLYPPPKLMHTFPFTSVAYRFYVIVALIVLTVLFHFIISCCGGGPR
ncbi:TMEM164 family protein, partial [Trypanosoma grayi]|uniref:TMEM164 family protein n=1 Tax=Trypanosoma grayi TaxID=71804 RepID=UPI0004F49FBB